MGENVIAKCTGIAIRYEGGPVEFYGGGHVDPLEIELGNRSTVITVDYAEWSDLDVSKVLTNSYVDVEVLASEADEAKGLQGLTLKRCKAVTWEITSTQDGFVTYRLELRKSHTT